MKLYFPPIYPDELIYSWFARYSVYAGCIGSKIAISQLLYSTSNNPSVEFIGHLNENAEKQIEKVYSLDDLIINHTMFPQYARFLSGKEKKEALEKIKKYCDPHKAVTILPRNNKEKYLKYCPLCVKEDRDTYGETFWHRKHQIRNVNVCLVHQCKLEDSIVAATTQKTFTLQPAEVAVKITKPTFIENTEQINFSKYAIELFEADMKENSNINVRAVIYNSMASTKYRRGQQRHMSQFADDLQAFYKGSGINSIASINQIQRVMLSESKEFSAICQIAYFLKISVKDLLKSDRVAVVQEKKSHYVKNRMIINWDKFDRENVVRFEQFCKGIYNGTANDNGRPERISEKMIYKFLGITSYGFKNMPKCKAVYEKYAESYEESWARKIVWAYNKLQQDEDVSVIYWSHLKKLSGVKKEAYHKAVPFLKKYTDSGTYEDIMKIG